LLAGSSLNLALEVASADAIGTIQLIATLFEFAHPVP
jgi:hypothetical protein